MESCHGGSFWKWWLLPLLRKGCGVAITGDDDAADAAVDDDVDDGDDAAGDVSRTGGSH